MNQTSRIPQPGQIARLTDPVCVLIDEDKSVDDTASLAGLKTFSSIRAFRRYVNEEILQQGSQLEDSEEASE